MNIIKGKIITTQEERDTNFYHLEEYIYNTLQSNSLDLEAVLNACDTFSKSIGNEHLDLLVKAGISYKHAEEYLREAKSQLSKENLVKRLKIELGYCNEPIISKDECSKKIKEELLPLGTLFHIVAGNQTGLAIYSAIEGLLTGNINLIKLSSSDNGLVSAYVFLELMKIEPILKDYIYLFDYSSKELDSIKKLMKLADAVVVWGGDESIRSIRGLVDPNTKIIEWGHKLSFAYVTVDGFNEKTLYGLAENIVKTNQLLCSSCQGIYVDTNSLPQIYQFCESFLPILDQCYHDHNVEIPIAIQAKTGLMVYSEKLENPSCQVFHGQNASLLAYEDSLLRPAIPYGNPWVKRLPRQQIIPTLRSAKSHLQSVGLLCNENDKSELTRLLWRAGVTRVANGINMSVITQGSAHDGEYPLRRYTKVASQEFVDEQYF